MDKTTIKVISLVLVIVLILNLILFAFGIVTVGIFWIIIAIIAVFAYKIAPKLRVN